MEETKLVSRTYSSSIDENVNLPASFHHTLFSSHSLLYSWSGADVFTSSCVQLQHGCIHFTLHVVCVCTRMCVHIYSIRLDYLQKHTTVPCLIKFDVTVVWSVHARVLLIN